MKLESGTTHEAAAQGGSAQLGSLKFPVPQLPREKRQVPPSMAQPAAGVWHQQSRVLQSSRGEPGIFRQHGGVWGEGLCCPCSLMDASAAWSCVGTQLTGDLPCAKMLGVANIRGEPGP